MAAPDACPVCAAAAPLENGEETGRLTLYQVNMGEAVRLCSRKEVRGGRGW